MPASQSTVPCGSAYSVKKQAQVHGSYVYVSATRTTQKQIVTVDHMHTILCLAVY